jgi:hypothetical protein
MIQASVWRITKNLKWTEDVEGKSPQRIIVLNLLYRRRNEGGEEGDCWKGWEMGWKMGWKMGGRWEGCWGTVGVIGKVGGWGWRIEDGG